VPAIYRAPMRARDRDLPPGAGAEHGVARGLVGIGDGLPRPPLALEEAVAAAAAVHGDKAGRMLRAFASVPDGSFVWTRAADGGFRLGRIAGPWRYDDSPAARAVGVVHMRPATWLERTFGEDDVPAAVAATFARGGRNFQRTRDERAEAETMALWDRSGSYAPRR
jgi:hypothetical protein